MKSNDSRTGLIFLSLFGGVFAVAGIAVGVTQIPTALQNGNTEELVVSLLLATLFTAVGLGLVWVGLYSRRLATEQERLRARYPDQPWMWKKEWAEGRIPGEGKKKMAFFWCFALFWNAISTPLIWRFPEAAQDEGPYAVALVALFPLVGIVMLIVAIRASLRWRKFGAAVFEGRPCRV